MPRPAGHVVVQGNSFCSAACSGRNHHHADFPRVEFQNPATGFVAARSPRFGSGPHRGGRHPNRGTQRAVRLSSVARPGSCFARGELLSRANSGRKPRGAVCVFRNRSAKLVSPGSGARADFTVGVTAFLTDCESRFVIAAIDDEQFAVLLVTGLDAGESAELFLDLKS